MLEEDVFICEGSGSTQGRIGAATDGAEVGGGVHGCVRGDTVMALFEGKLLNQSETVGKREEGSASGEALMRESKSWWCEAGHIM